MMNKPEIEAMFEYDRERGHLLWRGGRRGRGSTGRIAGHSDERGRVKIRHGGKQYFLHMLVWVLETGEWPSSEIDHVNGRSEDNRFSNLRLATRSQNLYNRRMPTTNTSGFKGVKFSKRRQKWEANIGVNGRVIYLGLHEDILSARDAYRNAAIKYHGEFART